MSGLWPKRNRSQPVEPVDVEPEAGSGVQGIPPEDSTEADLEQTPLTSAEVPGGPQDLRTGDSPPEVGPEVPTEQGPPASAEAPGFPEMPRLAESEVAVSPDESLGSENMSPPGGEVFGRVVIETLEQDQQPAAPTQDAPEVAGTGSELPVDPQKAADLIDESLGSENMSPPGGEVFGRVVLETPAQDQPPAVQTTEAPEVAGTGPELPVDLQKEVDSLRSELQQAQEERDQAVAERDQITAKLRDAATQITDANRRAELKEQEFDTQASEMVKISEFLPALDALDAGIHHSSNPARTNRDLLPILDTLAAEVESPQEVQMREGLIATRNQILSILGEDLERIETIGTVFDPEIHQAVQMEEGTGTQVVIEEFQPGYLLAGKVIRPAVVSVGYKSHEP